MAEPEAPDEATEKIALGVLGLGVMGAPMARRLGRRGFNPQVADPNPRTIQLFIMEGGANPAANATRLAQTCNVLVLAFSDDGALRDAVTGANGIVHGLTPGTVVIDMTGGDPETGAALARALVPRGALWVEAVPIGSPKQAAAGALTILAGGQKAPLERARPVLEAVAERVIRTGPVGSASLVKALAVMLEAFNLAAVTEALTVAKRFGMEPEAALDAIETAGGPDRAAGLQSVRELLSGHSGQHYPLTRAIADMDRVRRTAERSGIPLPLTAALRELSGAARLNLDGSDTLAALSHWIERVAKTPLR
jgi:3-hydroxyisobutyrate dehydrogenase-like beta-hydroxyacid dehydrogenase